jgi:hypothetical protein
MVQSDLARVFAFQLQQSGASGRVWIKLDLQAQRTNCDDRCGVFLKEPQT